MKYPDNTTLHLFIRTFTILVSAGAVDEEENDDDEDDVDERHSSESTVSIFRFKKPFFRTRLHTKSNDDKFE